jgi:hypothetical protein
MRSKGWLKTLRLDLVKNLYTSSVKYEIHPFPMMTSSQEPNRRLLAFSFFDGDKRKLAEPRAGPFLGIYPVIKNAQLPLKLEQLV